MEVAQYYTNRFNEAMQKLNVLPPSIEPHATGHIIEQEELVKQIMDNGFAYESNGSVYFDVVKYNETHRYGILSGRNLEDVHDASRELDGVGEKKHQVDFALWKRRSPNTSCAGPHPGAKVSRDGTANVRRWDANTWATTSIFTVAAWTWCSRTTNAKLHRLWRRKATRW